MTDGMDSLARMRRTSSIVAAAVLLAGPVVLAFRSGGYFDGPRLTGLFVVAVVLAVVAVATRPVLPRSAALAAVWLLAGWVLLSRGRSPLPDVAGDDFERVVLYAGFLLAGVAIWRKRSAARRAEVVVAAGALLVIVYGLAGRWLPGLVELTRTRSAGGRLEQPLTYWNATGLLAAMGAILCVRIAGDRDRPTGLRAVAAASVVPLTSGVYLSFSRGAAAALVAGLLVLVLCAPDRGQVRALVVTMAAGVAGVVVSGLLPGVRALEGSHPERDGLLALAATIIFGAVAAVLTARAARRADDDRAIALPRFVGPAVAVVVILAVLVPVLAGRNERAGRRPEAGFGANTQRFTNVNSNRYAYWRVALRTFGNHPVAGVGSGGWGVDWLRERPIADPARDAHSIELETLAELGLVGFALLLVLFGGTARAAVRTRRVDPALAAGPCAALTAWAAHSALDWDWEMPGVTLPALTLAAVLIAGADPPRDKRARPLSRVVLLVAAVACAVVGAHRPPRRPAVPGGAGRRPRGEGRGRCSRRRARAARRLRRPAGRPDGHRRRVRGRPDGGDRGGAQAEPARPRRVVRLARPRAAGAGPGAAEARRGPAAHAQPARAAAVG